MPTKICSRCCEEKAVTEFYPARSKGHAPGARKPDCKDCRKASVRLRYQEKTDHIKTLTRRWQIENRERRNASQRRRRVLIISPERLAKQSEVLRQGRRDLTDWYVRQLVVQHSPAPIRPSDVPASLIEAVRVHTLLNRELKGTTNDHD